MQVSLAGRRPAPSRATGEACGRSTSSLLGVVVGGADGGAGSVLAGPLVTANAADQPAAPPSNVGVIDMEKVAEEAGPVKDAYGTLNTIQSALSQNLQEIDSYPYLASGEMKELSSILEAKEQTPAQKARYTELKTTARDREKEYQRLTQVKDPKPEEKTRLQELTKMRNDRDPVMDEIKQGYSKKLNDRAGEILPKLSKQVEEVIQGIAKDKQLTVVLTKRVTTPMGKEDVVLFGGTDITEELIKPLNKK